MAEVARVEQLGELCWRSVRGGAEEARIAGWVRPDARCRLCVQFTNPDALAPLLVELRKAVDDELIVEVDAADSAAVEACERAGFVLKRRGIEYSLDPVRAAAVLGHRRYPNGVRRLPWDEVDIDRLRRLDDVLRQDVPGTDGWQWHLGDFVEECSGPHFDPDLYAVACDASGRYTGLCRVWSRDGRPARLGMIGVIADWRRRGLGHALLADIMRACADCRRSITLEIDEANGASTALFRSLGAVPFATGLEMTSARPDRAIREGALATVVAS